MPDDETFDKWMNALQNSKDLDVETHVKRKQGKKMRMKKNLGGKVATSGAGKSIIKEFLGAEVIQLIAIVKRVIKKKDGKAKAKEAESNIIKIGVKVILLIHNKDLTMRDIKPTLDRIKKLWSDLLDACEMSFCYDVEKIQESALYLLGEFKGIIQNFVSDENMEILEETITYISDEPLLDFFYLEDEQEVDRADIQVILRDLWDRAFPDQQH
eukprot:TRINITY_DN3104_c0_g1_i1.p1 TRINITY_DN3104_c0_g1~~TRINITY_DN3104_c0_g1_i1.p1  ORF type:complete len:213 (-),score=65.75 TRINITY_DN3104_c0_g1_i1:16-654(-)